MAITYSDYTGDGTNKDFAFSFPYLEDTHVVVEVDGATKTTTAGDFTLPTTSLVRMTVAPVDGASVRVKRDSNADSSAPLVDFVNGSVLTESSLDRSYLHNLYLNEEIGELNQLSLQKEVAGTEWDAKTLRVKNVATATDTTDAVNKTYVDTQISNQITGSSTASAKYAFTGAGSAAFTFSPAITLGDDTMYEVAIDGVLQEPTVAYAIDADANTITFTSTPPTSSKIVVVQRGYSVPVTTPHTGDVTGTTALTIASNAVTSAKISSTDVTFNVNDTHSNVGVGVLADATGTQKLKVGGSAQIGATTSTVPGQLSVTGNGSQNVLTVENTSSTGSSTSVLLVKGPSCTLQLNDTQTSSPNTGIYNVTVDGGHFQISLISDDGGTATGLLRLTPDGNLTIKGTLTESSGSL